MKVKHFAIRGGVILNILLTLIIVMVTYKSGYYKKLYSIVTCSGENPKETPDYWAVRGWANTVKKLDLRVDIAFFGNSITYFSNFDECYKKDSISIINLGYPGDNIEGMISRVDMLKSCNPQKVFLMAGINGLEAQTIEHFKELYTELLDSIQKDLPYSHIYIQSILPVNEALLDRAKGPNSKIVEANAILQQLSENRECTYINLFDLYCEDGQLPKRYTKDGLHLLPEAYEPWADAIDKYIKE